MRTKQKRMRVLVVIPAFNEQGKIGNVVARVPRMDVESVLVVDDCSCDGTAEEALAAGAELHRQSRNLGVGAAIRSGIDHAIGRGYDVVAILAGDDQHDPADLAGLLRPILEQGFAFVQGSRRLGGLNAPNIPWFRRSFTLLYTIMFRWLSGFPFTDATNGGRAFRTDIFKDGRINLWQDWLNTYELEPYLLYRAVRCGYKITEAPMKVIYHDRGTSKMKPFRDWWRIFRPVVFLWFGFRK
jgi:dolichol-phosphate mannosyltransferase